MNKAERKRRAQEMKRKAKLAKRAKRDANSQTGDGAPAAGPSNGEATLDQPKQASERVEQAAAPTETGEGTSVNSGQAPGATAPTRDEIHTAHAKVNWAEADVLEGELSAKLGDDEAVELLTKAARALGDVIDYVQDLIERLPKDQVAEAIRIQNRPRTYHEKSRNGANPVVQLLNILLRAKGLIIRVVKLTNPELAKRMKTQR